MMYVHLSPFGRFPSAKINCVTTRNELISLSLEHNALSEGQLPVAIYIHLKLRLTLCQSDVSN